MKPVRFTARIEQFGSRGEKTGWIHVIIPAEVAGKIKPGNKKEFKVKGFLDSHPVSRVSLLPMGDGSFVLPLNAALRKAIGKRTGSSLQLLLEADDSAFVFNADFMACLEDDPAASEFFTTLTGSHQRYFSKWIDSAKTEPTRTKRIGMALNALARGWGYPEMMRAARENSA
jgi:hypothetical protein